MNASIETASAWGELLAYCVVAGLVMGQLLASAYIAAKGESC